MEPELSVVIPAHNESARLGPTLAAISSYLKNENVNAEIIVVDDGSTDNTRKLAETILDGSNGSVISYANCRGKGYAVRAGVARARGQWVLFSDADLSTPIEEYRNLREFADRDDFDLVLGSRGLPGSEIEISQSRLRQSMGKCFNFIVRLISGIPFKDTQCGFKLFRRRSVGPLFSKMVVDGFAFDVELLVLCKQAGVSMFEAPVLWRNDDRSSVRLLSSPPAMLWDVVKTMVRLRCGRYGPGATPPPGRAND